MRESLERALQYVRRSRVQLALSRAAATAPLRALDPSDPDTWEFSAFSAAGEDGIIDHLTRRMRDPEFSFLEIGASDGVANNTAWLAIARRWQGVMVDADTNSVRRARSTLAWFNPLVQVLELTVTDENVDVVLAALGGLRPDVFSLDVDGRDYYIARALFDRGLRPRLCVVEYNSAYGPENQCTVNPVLMDRSHDPLYYGVSIAGWRAFFATRDYHFIGVERTGVNAFFAHRDSFDADFLEAIEASGFRENISQRRSAGAGWERQIQRLSHFDLVEIPY